MTEQEKQLLFRDLCARLPYGVKVNFAGYSGREDCTLNAQHLNSTYSIEYLRMKPYLRPMSSMTEKEYETFPTPYSFDSFSTWNNTILSKVIEGTQILIGIDEITEIIDWLNAHHFDFRGLIKKGLALEAPEGMYNTKTE